MSSQLRFPTYNAPPWGNNGKGPASVGLVLLGIGIGMSQLVKSGIPLWLAFGIFVLVLALAFGLAGIFRRMYTDTDRDYLIVRGAFRTRRTAWRDIQAIEIERHWAGMDYAVANDRDGRKITLPFVNSGSLPDLQADVSELRELWATLRGEDWSEAPELSGNSQEEC